MSAKVLLKTERFFVELVQQEHRDGSKHQRHVVRHPGSVAILPVLDDGRICLIKNFRVSAGQTLIEVPAGTLEPGEPPKDCALRELQEETGFIAEQVEPLIDFYAAPGITDERMHLFLAKGLKEGSPQREANEQIDNFIVSIDQAMQMVARNEIADAKTICALTYFRLFTNR